MLHVYNILFSYKFPTTVEPLNKGRYGANDLYREVIPISKVK